MDDLVFYGLQPGTNQSEVSLLRRLLPEPDTVPWPYGSKKVSVCSKSLPDSKEVHTGILRSLSAEGLLKGEKESSPLDF